MQQRREEILAKKAKLAELKRQRELRANQATATRQSIGSPSELIAPQPGRGDNRRDIEALINTLVGESRPGSTTTGGAASPAHRGSRPNSVLSAGEISNETSEVAIASALQPAPPPPPPPQYWHHTRRNPSAPHDPDGLVQVWSHAMHDRPEFVFHAQSDVLTAKFSPYHRNLIVGGSYSGQVLLWDTRAKSAPVQKTPLTGYGHTHPIYSVDIVGTQNANNIISCSTDGIVCGWSMDVFAQPQETLELKAPPSYKIDDVSPTCLAFPQADPTFFLVGSEEGSIFPCHRYDRAGAKAGIDARFSYKGHTAPVMSVDFHPARGPVDLGDLVLSSSLDWSVRLWKVRAPAATSTAGGEGTVSPLIDFVREDVVYDAKWSPIKPGVFSLVDGAGWLELWDITVETEEPVARISPSARKDGRTMLSKSLNKVTWEPSEGKRLATGGIDGALTVFEVASGLGGTDDLKAEEWTNVKKLVNRVEAVGANGIVSA
ncbi:cytoplasmic dynein 1 intermediate chain 1 [Verticillium alfalfae VaMs.102]|uniref:Cytoplasmic dynein 1 intermediate chain 1 n=1 Tax=Verticillium alfalfae (strain VaMs.102 / ATCC MYA-4576 / FGSC 10136) TaxID=526221 RepID=C9SME7_VERA1|nr:cytoplasmic dynein 1 intermediate chain 1 [Verticillium alfalfae VaMs.102]EEY19962.1 cytoplasmic dynein 1 intermediate chain 1 [Verticillium alfalfae VaMs.102]